MFPATLRTALISLALVLMQSPRPAGGISGRVVDASSGEPLADATVSIAAISGRALPPTAAPIVTNERGEFIFSDLPPGSYDLSARRNRYIALAYGQRPGSGLPGIGIALADRQQIQDVVIRLPLTSVLAGLVTDTRGEPAQGTTVLVHRLEWRNGERGARNVASGTVDDRGQYRVPGLVPGEYLVAAAPAASAPLRTVTYFPGSPEPTQAQPVTLGPSEEQNGINIQLTTRLLASVSGLVVDTDGKPVPNVKIAAVENASPFKGLLFYSTYSTATGTFRFANLPPGRYELVASEDRAIIAGTRRWARADLIANGNDVKDVSLVLRFGERISGRLLIDGSARPAADPHLTLVPVDRDPTNSASFVGLVPDDGSLVFLGIMPGRYVMAASTPPAGYIITSVRVDGQELADLSFDVNSSRTIRSLDVTLSSRGASVSGTLLDRSGRPNTGVLAIIYPAEESYWLPGSPRIRTARPDTDGRYSFRSLPPGAYRVGVVTDAEPGQWFSPVFLRRLVPDSTTVTLALGEVRAMDLRAK